MSAPGAQRPGRVLGRPGRPRLAELVSQVRAALPPVPAVVVDAGGGTGQVAVLLAAAGYEVTVVDPSAAMLATCADRAAEHGAETSARLRTVQGDAERVADLLGPAVADAVLCHGVLEVVEDPAGVVRSLAAVLRPGGTLSLLAANRARMVLRAGRRGDYLEAVRLLDDPFTHPPRGTDPGARAWTAAEIRPWCEAAGLEVVAEHGLRAFAEPPPDADSAQLDALRELEHRAAGREPYRSVAEHLHLVARRPAGG